MSDRSARLGAFCPACRSHDVSPTGIEPIDFEGFSTSTKAFDVVRCNGCRSLFLDPPPTLTDTEQFYSEDYMSKSAHGAILRRMVDLWDGIGARRFAKRFGASAAVLDYGCGDGSFVQHLIAAGCTDVSGYEPMPIAPATSAPIYRDLDALIETGKRFDVIRLHNSIEHLVEVDATMSKLRALLEPGGCVSGETANGAHLSSKTFGALWGYLHYPYHTVIFSPRGLIEAARRWGYSKAETRDTLTPGAWSFTFEHAAKKWLGITRRGHLAVYPLMLLASGPPVLLDRLLPGRTTAMFFRLDA